MTSAVPPPSDADLTAMLEHMLSARVYSGRLFNLQRQGRVGTMAPIDGNEAAVVGAAAALDPATDWVVPQYREAVALGRYGDEIIDIHTLYLTGHPGGGHYPEHLRVFPIQISLAAQLPHAVGLAWGLQLRGEAGVVAAFFGDGASSEGDFYEAANFAGVLRAPVIFVLVNNHWAISTPVARQSAVASLADKAVAAGFPGVQVDGRDPVAVWEVVTAARARALAGEGPTLVECVTYRLGPHTTADDPTRYVPPEELEAERARDPIVTFGARLRELGLWSDAKEEEVRAAALRRMDLALERAEAATLEPTALFEHIFAELTPRQARQRDEVSGNGVAQAGASR
ncbi:MAG: pyruvate dehydrogenase (acetyl-transferring) E1 component subunit alpha [Acidimicrobiia bacterium]|nr:pyruvate dehydrogenase (acetyl-transferring) E1 component subunit alpha [Acidimicrobiia bacterium]